MYPVRPALALAVVVLLTGEMAGCTTNGASPIATPTLAPTNPTCSSNLRVHPGEVDAAAGHRFLVLRFTNVGEAPCTITGYPEVALVDDSGNVVKHAKQTLRGQAGLPAGTNDPPVVTLLPGKSASAVVEASAIPRGDNPTCRDHDLLVTPPGQKRAVPAGPAMLPDCDVQVHPVVVGSPR